MKALIVLVLLAAGCSPNYCQPESPYYNPELCQAYYQRLAAGFRNMNNGLNQAYRMDQQMQSDNTIVYPQNNTTYWQERRAQQEYLDNMFP